MENFPTVNSDTSWLNSARQSMSANGGPELRSRLHTPTLSLTTKAKELARRGELDCDVKGKVIPTAHLKNPELEADAGVLHSTSRRARALSEQACTHRLAGGRAAFASRPRSFEASPRVQSLPRAIGRGSLGR